MEKTGSKENVIIITNNNLLVKLESHGVELQTVFVINFVQIALTLNTETSESEFSLASVKSLYSKKDYKGAIKAGEDLLPQSSNPQLLSEVRMTQHRVPLHMHVSGPPSTGQVLQRPGRS